MSVQRVHNERNEIACVGRQSKVQLVAPSNYRLKHIGLNWDVKHDGVLAMSSEFSAQIAMGEQNKNVNSLLAIEVHRYLFGQRCVRNWQNCPTPPARVPDDCLSRVGPPDRGNVRQERRHITSIDIAWLRSG